MQPRTVIAWQRQRFRDHWRQLSQHRKSGRPAIANEVRTLTRTMWQSNPTWGAPWIVGELQKLGIDVAKSTVETYRGNEEAGDGEKSLRDTRLHSHVDNQQLWIGCPT